MKKWKQSLTALALAAAVLSQSAPALAAEAVEEPATPTGLTLNGGEHAGYISGGGGLFRPDSSLSRAEAAQILSRLLEHPVPTLALSDVAADAWYAEAAGMMGFLGLMGTASGAFRPEDPITRGEFLAALAGFYPSAALVPQFSDVSPWDPDGAAYVTARSLGWCTGFEDGTLRPEQALTRAEAVAMLNRALGRSADRSYIDRAAPLLYMDVARDAWYYYDVMEAAIPHQHTDAYGAEAWTGHTAVPVDLSEGFHLYDGWLYCCGPEGLVHGASVGNFPFDENGRFTSGNAALDARLRNIVLSVTNGSMTQEQKLRALYVYTRDSFTYLRRPAYGFGVLDFMEKDALNMLETGYGNCYCYASVFWYLARWIGYDAKIYSGTVGSNKAPHSWVEINFGGTDYIFDTELEMAYHKKGRYEIDLYKYIDVDNWQYVK